MVDDRRGRRLAGKLAVRIDGRVHGPGTRRYEGLRRPWNRTLDPRPALVCEPATGADLPTVLRFARDAGLPVVFQATGHGAVLPTDGALLVVTAGLAGVAVDPAGRRARCGPGATVGQLVRAAARFGLVPVAGHPGVGVVGFTLGGGVGWLSRRYGLAADSLRSVDLVTAGGERLTAGAGEHPDLHWALRGGGPNFGAVTGLEVDLHPVDRAYAGVVSYPAGAAAGLLERYPEWAAGVPDTVNVGLVFSRPQDGRVFSRPLVEDPVVTVRGLVLGSAAQGRRWLRPLLAPAGRPEAGGFGWVAVAGLGGAPAPPTARRQRADLLADLPPGAGRTLLEWLAAAPAGTVVEIRHWGGAASRPYGPSGRRDVRFSVLTTVPARAGDRCCLEDLGRRLRPYATGGTFLNFRTEPGPTATAFAPDDYRRLRALKRRYDPSGVFGFHQHIPPDGAPVTAPDGAPVTAPAGAGSGGGGA